MVGIELDPKALAFDLPGYGSRTPTLVAQAVVGWMLKQHRVLVQSTAKASPVIKVVPPLVLSDDDVDWFVDAFAETLVELSRGRAAAVRGLLRMLVQAPDVVLREAFR